MEITVTSDEQTFFQSYLEAVYFTEQEENPGADLDADFERESLIECLAMFGRIECFLNVCDATIEQAGHDFWLTRNGHGVGYWDRPEIYGETYAAMFTKMAETFGVADAEF